MIENSLDNFYGVTSVGGTNGNGALFNITPIGTLQPVFLFNGFNGSRPSGIAIGENGNLYGTAGPVLGLNIYGSMFDIGTNGTFNALQTNRNFISFCFFYGTNGSMPLGQLQCDNDGTFYGITEYGGTGFNNNSSTGGGTVYSINTNGVLTVLCMFNGTNGLQPLGGLQWGKDGNLYGTTTYGGTNYSGGNGTGDGTVFEITTNGNLTTLAFFTGTNGANPYAGLTLGSDGNFYGTTFNGGSFNLGTVFQITTNGNLTTLVSFNGTNGCNPSGALAQANDGNLYGTTTLSTLNRTNYGTIFQITTNGNLTTLAVLNGTNGSRPFTDLTLGQDGNIYGAVDDILLHQLLDGSYGHFIRLAAQPELKITRAKNAAVISWASFTNGVYRIDYTSSLTNATWAPLMTNTTTTGICSITNTSLNIAERFYRVVLP